jgi:ABC-2 type transport system ATP-binding protein
VRADALHDLTERLNGDSVEITSTERGTITVRGLDAATIGRIACDAGIPVTSLVPEQRSLEDVFMSLTATSVQYHGADSAHPIGAAA